MTRRFAYALGVAGALIWLALGPAGHAASPVDGTLSSADGTVTWTGKVATGKEDWFDLNVNLPAGTWDSGGGVQIGIHWPYKGADPGDNQDLDLYVFDPSGKQVARSNDTDEDTESITIPKPKNGTYSVLADGYDSRNLPYTGRAEVIRPAATAPVRDLLPDLAVEPDTNVKFAGTQLAYRGRYDAHLINGCFAEERAENQAMRCLRFDQTIANYGDGPLEVRYHTNDLVGRNMYQRIYRSDGTTHDRAADHFVFHPTHRHFHYVNFALTRLWRSNANGDRLDSEPVKTGRKTGFCMIDVLDLRFDTPTDASRGYTSDRCVTADQIPQGAEAVNGISVGWADLYNWYLPDQYIDVFNVPDGWYQLETVADPINTLVEKDETNNAKSTLIRLCGDKVETAGGPHVCP